MDTDDGAIRHELAIVTGASSGIGLALARQFAEHEFDLIVAAEDAEIHNVAKELKEFEVEVDAVRCDLSTEAGVEKLVDAIGGRQVDAIAINAGIGVGGDFRETDLREELRLVDLNCRSVVHLAKRVIPDMAARGSGRALFTASIAALSPSPFEAVYGASKAFVLSFAEALHNELKDSGVTITALMPGPTETNFFRRAGMEDTKLGVAEKDDPKDVARQGFEAMMAGKDRVVAGSTKNRLRAVASKVMSEQAKAEIHRDMSEPGSAEKVKR